MEKNLLSLTSIPKKHYVIPNPVDHGYLEEQARKPCSCDFGRGQFLIAAVGRLIEKKNYDLLISVVATLESRFRLILIGDGPERTGLEKMSETLNVKNRVHFMGRQTNPFNILSHCDLFVLSSKSEGFPNVLVESMCLGLPVISSDCETGPREILDPQTMEKINGFHLGEYGGLFPVGNREALAEGIRLFAGSEGLRKDYGKKARERSLDFRVDEIVDRYISVLNTD
jgi:N-acetylgalactosamine-N,N'-diacetylbacillosaminyl-diphospho-undecaprenol 4-alpha-N-acetylgalactosaminyltransferase